VNVKNKQKKTTMQMENAKQILNSHETQQRTIMQANNHFHRLCKKKRSISADTTPFKALEEKRQFQDMRTCCWL